ncbi:MAG: hypothetical protein KI788_00575 [Mameliella sp.]|nr:hypothetical protein [Mameliella sp.]
MAEDDSDKIRRLFPDLPVPDDWDKKLKSYEDLCKDTAIRDVVGITHEKLAEFGDEAVGVATIIITREAADMIFAYSPSCYETDFAYAMMLATMERLKMQLNEDAENHRMFTATVGDLDEDDGDED